MKDGDQMLEFYWDAFSDAPKEFSSFHEAEDFAAELRQSWRGVKYGIVKVEQPLRKSSRK